MKKLILGIFLISSLSLFAGDVDLRILKSAIEDLHTKEITKIGISNPKIVAYHQSTGHNYSDNIAWCSSFVNYHVKKVGYKGTNSPAAASWRKWGKSVKYPLVGAIAVKPRFDRKGKRVGDHVGIIKSIDYRKKTITLLGGNQGKIGEVKESIYPMKVFDSFRIPNTDIKTYNVEVDFYEYEEEITNSIKMTQIVMDEKAKA